MHPVFRNALFQKDFDDKGYVLIPSLLSHQEINLLLRLFEEFQSQCAEAFHSTHFSKDTLYKRQVHDTISKLVAPNSAVYLNSFEPLFGNFMVKNPDRENFMPLHADWTYVNEHEFNSVAIWVPLVDVNEKNGCFGVVEGSHMVTNTIRGPGIYQSSSLERDKVWEKRYGKLIPMKAGDAIFYNHSLLHYSPPNKTKQVRPALNLTMVPEPASRIHYCKPEGATEIEMYNVTESNFYIAYDNFQRPQTGVPVKILPVSVVKQIDPQMDWFWLGNFLNKIRRRFKLLYIPER